jgi:hypothetical protein
MNSTYEISSTFVQVLSACAALQVQRLLALFKVCCALLEQLCVLAFVDSGSSMPR